MDINTAPIQFLEAMYVTTQLLALILRNRKSNNKIINGHPSTIYQDFLILAQDDTLMFEGKGFHYLDPGAFAVDDDQIRNTDIADTFDNLEDGSFPGPEKVTSHVFEG
eukprot:306003_1